MIGVDRDLDPCRSQRFQPDEACQPIGAERRRQRIAVLVVPRRLRVDQHPETRRPRGGLGVDEVPVNHGMASIRARRVPLRRLDAVEHDVDAGIAGDMRHHLPATAMNDASRGGDLFRRERQETAIAGIVGRVEIARTRPERLSHERRTDQDSAVRDELERPRLQPLVSIAEPERQPVDEALDGGRVACVRDADRHRGPDVQAPGVLQAR